MRIRGDVLHEQRVEAFTNLFDLHWARVRHHIECIVEDDDEVSDLISEVFALAWKKLDPRRPIGLPWLLRVAENKLKDRDRRSLVRERAMEALRRAADPGDSDPLDALAVRQAIDKVLNGREQQMIALFYWDRLAAGEIAELIHCSQSAVFTTLSRARAKLEAELGRDRVRSAAERSTPDTTLSAV